MIPGTVEVKNASLKHMLLLELFISALLPVTSLLILAVIGIRTIPASQAGLFIIVFIFCSSINSIGICFVLLQTQQMIKKRLLSLITACQAQRSGQGLAQAPVYGRDEFARLASEINYLIQKNAPGQMGAEQEKANVHQHTAGPTSSQTNVRQGENALLKRQLEQLLEEVSPVMSGDLRVHAQARTEGIGTLADTVNYLIEELVHLHKQIRAAADHILSATQDLLDRSITMAQTTETQMQLLLHTTEHVEKLVAFTQRLSGVLDISAETATGLLSLLERGDSILQALAARVLRIQRFVDAMQMSEHDENGEAAEASFVLTPRAQQRLREDVGEISQLLAQLYHEEPTQQTTLPESENEPALFTRLSSDVQRLRQLLTSVEQSTGEKVSAAEEVVSELYTLAQRIHQASMGVLNAAERISSLAVLANEWRTMSAEILLPGDNPEGTTHIYQEDGDLGSVTPSLAPKQ